MQETPVKEMSIQYKRSPNIIQKINRLIVLIPLLPYFLHDIYGYKRFSDGLSWKNALKEYRNLSGELKSDGVIFILLYSPISLFLFFFTAPFAICASAIIIFCDALNGLNSPNKVARLKAIKDKALCKTHNFLFGEEDI